MRHTGPVLSHHRSRLAVTLNPLVITAHGLRRPLHPVDAGLGALTLTHAVLHRRLRPAPAIDLHALRFLASAVRTRLDGVIRRHHLPNLGKETTVKKVTILGLKLNLTEMLLAESCLMGGPGAAGVTVTPAGTIVLV